MNQPGFYAIIPAHIRYCKELEPNAKLLYGELTALATATGYCWASNAYFAELYDVDISTIKRWITSLKDQNFIKIEIFVEGIQRKRKIWISPEIQKIVTKAQKQADVGSKMSPRRLKNEPCINTESNTDEEREEAQAPVSLPFQFKRVKMAQEKYDELCEKFGKRVVDEKIEKLDEYADLKPKKFKEYGCHFTVVRNWIKKDMESKGAVTSQGIGQETRQEIEANNRSWASQTRRKFFEAIKADQIRELSSGWEFNKTGKPANLTVLVEFKDPDFIESCIVLIEQMGIQHQNVY
jgi:DNA-binding MarR family transcriptional regulator